MVEYENYLEEPLDQMALRNGNNENGTSNNEPNPSMQILLTDKDSGMTGPSARWQKAKWWKKNLSIFLFFILSNAFTAFISVMLTKSFSAVCPVKTILPCPSEWVGYEGKCYYFSETEGTWYLSQSNCSASGASLIAIESQKEMNFIMQHKEPTDYWIGLKRGKGQPWELANGTVFNGWFEIGADGFCAYLNDEKASSTLCETIRNWICSKSAHVANGLASSSS